MNIDDYRYITTIAEFGSFTKAAQELFIAQPSLSQRVKHIEKAYGINIFSRDAKGVSLTKEGACFVKYAQAILNSESDLRRELADMQSIENRVLRVGTTQFIQSYQFDMLIKTFHDKHPMVQFEISDSSSRDQQEQLLAGKIDIAICYLPLISKDIKYDVIFKDNYVLIPAKGGSLEGKIMARGDDVNEPVPVSMLEGEAFATAPSGTRLYDYMVSLQEKSAIHLDIQHLAKNYSMLYGLAESGMASTILYESYFDPNHEYMPYYYIQDEESELEVAIMWRKEAYLQQEVRELIRLARKINQMAIV